MADDIFDDARYVHPLTEHLRRQAEDLRRAGYPVNATTIRRAADVVEELYRQNVVLRRTLGMEPLPPLDIC